MVTVASSPRELVLVDGRSGAGKTQWATQRATASGFFLLSLDDIYPGWDGLDAGHWRVYREGILPWLRGEKAALPRWDWGAMAPGGTIEIPSTRSLIIEGCGALSSFTSPLATHRYWIEADADIRRRRALERDGEVFSTHWQRWALQEERFYAIHRSRDLADEIILT